MPYLVAALYKFVSLPDYAEKQAALQALCEAQDVKGTLLLADEGINGTIAGPEAGVRTVLDYIRSDPRLADLVHKESWATKPPFYRAKVRLKKEIVTLGVPGVSPTKMAGKYVKPEDWNALISDPDVVVVDTRNDYEVAIGSFKGALNPQTRSFREFPAWVRAHGELRAKPKVAMFCTGGIRCEKSTALLRAEGFEEVYHLEGGILKYLETVPEAESLWQGECFVFDERVAVGHGLTQGQSAFCRSCRYPLTPEDRQSPQYEQGISCPHCYGQKSEEKLQRLREREKQIRLAEQRQQVHMGRVYPPRAPRTQTERE